MKEKTKLHIFFSKKILIKITKVLFDAQMISQKILGLDTFFTEWKKMQKLNESKRSPSDIYLTVVQDKEN